MRAGWDPPRNLLLILAILTLTSVSAVVWFGWRLAQQEAIVENQRAQDRPTVSRDGCFTSR
jgi:hypothetical protein